MARGPRRSAEGWTEQKGGLDLTMVKLSRINGAEVTVNAELIETVEATPDTIVALTTGKRLMVVETIDQVVEKVMAYRRSIATPLR